MTFRHAQVSQQDGHRLGNHRAAVVGMQRELGPLHALLGASFSDY
jgi:hypothetical protein